MTKFNPSSFIVHEPDSDVAVLCGKLGPTSGNIPREFPKSLLMAALTTKYFDMNIFIS